MPKGLAAQGVEWDQDGYHLGVRHQAGATARAPAVRLEAVRLQGRVEKFGELVEHVVDFNCIRILHGRLFDILLIISHKNTNNPLFHQT